MRQSAWRVPVPIRRTKITWDKVAAALTCQASLVQPARGPRAEVHDDISREEPTPGSCGLHHQKLTAIRRDGEQDQVTPSPDSNTARARRVAEGPGNKWSGDVIFELYMLAFGVACHRKIWSRVSISRLADLQVVQHEESLVPYSCLAWMH